MEKSDFEIIPAIDILDGKCVRLTQGKYDLVEKFSDNPEEIAKKWVDEGASRLHIVDLDGAKDGYPVNFKVISRLVSSTKVKIQVGGGIRNDESIKNYLNEGVSFIILGTKAFQDRKFLKEILKKYADQIIIGLDLKNNRVAVSGWQNTTDIGINDLGKEFDEVKQIIYTDISKDGTLSGPNINSVSEIADIFKSKIIVSGGISSLEDIISLLNMRKNHKNVTGVILGKSLYKGSISLNSAINLVKKSV